MDNSKEPLFVVVMASHKNCPLLSLKEKFRNSIGKTTVKGLVHCSPARHVICVDVKTSDLKNICSAITQQPESELIDVMIHPKKAEESRVYMYVKDPLLGSFTQDIGSIQTSWIVEYQLYDKYIPFNGSAEYLHLFTPDSESFLNRVRKLKQELKDEEINIEYRFHRGIEKGEVAGLTIQEQYIVESILETNYFEKYDKNELKRLADELDENLDEFVKTAEDLCAKTYLMGAMEYFSK